MMAPIFNLHCLALSFKAPQLPFDACVVEPSRRRLLGVACCDKSRLPVFQAQNGPQQHLRPATWRKNTHAQQYILSGIPRDDGVLPVSQEQVHAQGKDGRWECCWEEVKMLRL